MKLNFTRLTRFGALLISGLLLSMLSACGGGNGSAGDPMGPGNGVNNGMITLRLTNTSNQDISVIPIGSVGLATANVTDAIGNPIPNVLVTFTVSKNPTAGTISPADGFAATNSSGNAQVTVLHGTSGESGEITATVTVVNASPISDTVAFQSQ